MSDLQCAATLLLTDAGGSPALGASLVDRRLAAVYAIADLHRGETVLVVSHTATLQTGVPPLVGLGEEYGAAHPVPPGAVVEVAADADGWVLRSWAASG